MKTITVRELADLLGSEFEGNGDSVIEGINSLSDSGEKDLSFIVSEKYKELLKSTKAQVILVPRALKELVCRDNKTFIYCENPNLVFSRIVNVFGYSIPECKSGIHPSAVVDITSIIPKSCYIGPNVVIQKDVKLGDNTKILAGVFIGEHTVIGRDCIIYPNCVIRERTQIGNDVIIHSGVCIGSDGFGYEKTPCGLVKIPQIGYVRIDDDVEIGANATIDRARFGATWIKKGVKIDNLVQVAHNVEIGENSILIGQSGLAGSAKIGKGVIIAGQAGVSHGIKVGDGAMIAGQAGITQDVPAGERWGGTPAKELRETMMILACPDLIKKLKLRISSLEKTVKALREELDGF